MNGAKPDNLILVHSNQALDVIVDRLPVHFDKVFNIVTKKNAHLFENDINCHGACIDCLKCYQKNNGISVITEIQKQGIK